VHLGRPVFFLLLLVLVSCRDEVNRTAAIGELFAGPATLPLRKDVSPKSAVTATAKHGDRLEVMEYRRRFVRVRTAEGKEGWTDARLLLTPEQMAELRALAKKSASIPSQGLASVFEQLNIHTEPSRSSPAFLQIPENGKVDVLAHRLTPRGPEANSAPVVRLVRPRFARRTRKEKTSGANIGPPPAPPPPGLPRNYQALSVPTSKSLDAARLASEGPQAPEKAPAPVLMDDWSMVRLKDGNVGWVLTRMLSMAIPDEVAQYSEGHRITSYFALGQVHDGDAVHNNWLWTTLKKGGVPYDYDAFRVFIWSRNHHRYETAKMEKNIVGHYPVLVDTSGSEPRFSILLEGDDDQLYRKSFVLQGNRVQFIDRTLEGSPTPSGTPNSVAAVQPATNPPADKATSWLGRLKQKWFR